MKTDLPVMPADWWPDEIMVTGRHKGCELAFMIKADRLRAGMQYLQMDLDCLRLSMWQALAMRRDDAGPVVEHEESN